MDDEMVIVEYVDDFEGMDVEMNDLFLEDVN